MNGLSRKLNLALVLMLTASVFHAAATIAAPPPVRPVFDAPGIPYEQKEAQPSYGAIAPVVSPRRELTAEQAFSQVLGDLQELGQTDPAALQQLLKQLQSAKPAHYPLVVQQFKSAYAYSRELRERKHLATQAAVESLPLDTAEPAAPRREAVQPRLLPQPNGQSRDEPLSLYPSTQLTSAESAIDALPEMSELRTIDPRQAAPLEPFVETASSMPAPPPRSAVHAVIEETWEQSLSRAIDGLKRVLRFENDSILGATGSASAVFSNANTLAEPVAPEFRNTFLAVATREQGESSVDKHIRLRLLELVAGQHQATSAPISGVSTDEQQFWSKQLTALATLLDDHGQPDQQRRAAAACAPLAEAEIQLRERCPLIVRNLALCSQINGYGALEPLANTTVKPGQRLTIYAELENYRSVPTSKGFHTAIATSYEILDATGNRVDGHEFPSIDDYCLRHRRDFYAQYRITLPARLAPGKYQLQLTIKDGHADKQSRGSLEFQIE